MRYHVICSTSWYTSHELDKSIETLSIVDDRVSNLMNWAKIYNFIKWNEILHFKSCFIITQLCSLCFDLCSYMMGNLAFLESYLLFIKVSVRNKIEGHSSMTCTMKYLHHEVHMRWKYPWIFPFHLYKKHMN